MRPVTFVLALALCVGAAANTSPYVGEHTADYWEDLMLVHQAQMRARVPHHGGSRPFFEAFTNALSDAEKVAFDRIHQGLPPDSSLEITEIPSNIPVYLKTCDTPELEGQSGPFVEFEDLQMSLDPKHVKVRLNAHAFIPEALSQNLTHHTVVTVEGVSLAGFTMSPMVLYDVTAPVCDLYDNFFGCPVPKGEFKLERKLKFPGLDAIVSMPKRLYNAQVKLFEGDRILSCLHLFMDMRADEERVSNPTPGVLELKIEGASKNAATLVQVTQPQPQQQVEQTPTFDHVTQGAAEPTVETTVSKPSSSGPLAFMKSMMDHEKPVAGVPQDTQDTALLQQLQLKNLQEQLKRQEDINKKQQAEYEKLKEKLGELDPSAVDNLKKTVNELLAVQKAKQEELAKEEEHQRREAELYKELTHMYQTYNLPPSTLPLTSPFPFSASSPILVPAFPTQTLMSQTAQVVLAAQHVASNPVTLAAQDRFPDLQFLSQVDTLLKAPPSDEVAVVSHSEVSDQSEVSAVTATETTTDRLQAVMEESNQAPLGGPSSATVPISHIEASSVDAESVSASVSVSASASPKPSPDADREADLPDVDNLIPSSPTFTDRDFGVSYVSEKVDDWVKSMCQPFVTLSSGLSTSFCVPPSWQGLTALVITEPFTGEKGVFADKVSVSAPTQQRDSDATQLSQFPKPNYVGVAEMLLRNKYATIIATFNPDTFIQKLPYLSSELMGAIAAFVDYAGEPSTTIVTGVGWGGVLAVQLLERHGGCRLHGGLVLDSPIGSARWQGDYYGDILTLFEWVSPRAFKTITTTRNGALSHLLLESWEKHGRPYVYHALTQALNITDPSTSRYTSPRDLKMLEMLRALNIRCSYRTTVEKFVEPDLQCLYEEMTNAVRKAALYVLSYRIAFAQQDPYDNYRTLYVPEAFPHLNEDLSRKMADEAPLNHQTRFLETSGLLKVPLVLLNTKRDPEVPGWQAGEYMRKQKQVCESNGLGIRVINDTMDRYFGHAHGDTQNKDLGEELQILYSLIKNVRVNDDSSLTQRSWVAEPLKVVNPELSECPFPGYWYRDMASLFRSAIKSGHLITNNKIAEIVGEPLMKQAASFAAEVPKADASFVQLPVAVQVAPLPQPKMAVPKNLIPAGPRQAAFTQTAMMPEEQLFANLPL